MAQINRKTWEKYIGRLRKLSDKAAEEFKRYLSTHKITTDEQAETLYEYAYALVTKYGEGTSALACEMYEALAKFSGATVPAAVPARTARAYEVESAVRGAMNQSLNEDVAASAVGRLVKMAGVDTIQQNALRDGAEWAWVPNGDTCAFCIMLASNGWQKASRKALTKDGHAAHVHANCDCSYAVRFSSDVTIAGYDPDKYADIYQSAEGRNYKKKLNSMRRDIYAENKDRINAQKRSAYEKRKERESSSAEELNVD